MGHCKSLTFHVARHSFATLAISHGVPIKDVASMLGHEDGAPLRFIRRF
ncbi:MAG: tyrosine-type recombinase/integrase [Bacteroides sp.]|nr:tyrosine-type recombinase/integrase [Bacteroides sp.]